MHQREFLPGCVCDKTEFKKNKVLNKALIPNINITLRCSTLTHPSKIKKTGLCMYFSVQNAFPVVCNPKPGKLRW